MFERNDFLQNDTKVSRTVAVLRNVSAVTCSCNRLHILNS
jgi:hypothetical protein